MAGLVFIDGNLLTQDPARLHAEALAVEGDRIAAVGSRTDVERAVRPGARTVDLGGRTLVPGFNDAHAHAWKLGQLLTSVLDLRGIDSVGLVSGHLPLPTAAEYEEMVGAFGRHQLERGITSSSDCGVRPELVEMYRALDARDTLTQRLNVMPLRRLDGRSDNLPLPDRSLTARLRVDTVKLLADGGLSSATAALRESYRHADGRGVHRFEEEELRELMRETHAAGWRLAVHAIGDEAIERVLSAYESLGPEAPRRRHRIEHLGLPDRGHLRRAATLGIVAVSQTVFIHSLGRNFCEYLPEALLARTYPVREMMEAGITVALSSDAPVVEEDSPLLGIQAAVLRRDAEGFAIAPDQAISAAEAQRAYTAGGAFASGDEANRGTLSPGKRADMAVLSDDPVAVDPEGLSRIRVDMTVVGSKVFER